MSSLSDQLKLSALAAGAIMITVSLAWDNAITALINQYIPEQYANSKNAWIKLIYAIVLTVLALLFAKYFAI